MDSKLKALIEWIALQGYRPLGSGPLLYPAGMGGHAQVVDSIALLSKIDEIYELDKFTSAKIANVALDNREKNSHD